VAEARYLFAIRELLWGPRAYQSARRSVEVIAKGGLNLLKVSTVIR